jgi:hypothetical protein
MPDPVPFDPADYAVVVGPSVVGLRAAPWRLDGL